ncbi:MAG: UDP-N-acetylglucosamine 2-epimerase (hydrolyzing) [Chloroflexi bacterium]|nr:UDP-N-acetylglucosamine 2-epimerase (hydrolyzing) [Chloroflexota bacterium]
MRTIGVVTGTRADYGIYLPVLRKIKESPELKLQLIVTGSHLMAGFGNTSNVIEDDGFHIDERVDMQINSDSPGAIAESMGFGTIGFSKAFTKNKPDILLLQGDRFEIHAAAVAALPFNIPVAHMHGGELTEGAIDDSLRHSITKLSHLHFVATEEYRDRVIQMGEAPWRVVVSGAPSLDNLNDMALLTREELESQTGLSLEKRPILVTFHPVTLEYQQTEWQVGEMLKAIQSSGHPTVFTAPNADTGSRAIKQLIEEYVEANPNAQLVDSLGTHRYYSLMALASAMVGNSSSGLVEAPSLGLPVVNIGTRQHRRIRGPNVIDVGNTQEEISRGIAQATDPAFAAKLAGLPNPYGEGNATTTIVEKLKSIQLDDILIRKSFHDLPSQPSR